MTTRTVTETLTPIGTLHLRPREFNISKAMQELGRVLDRFETWEDPLSQDLLEWGQETLQLGMRLKNQRDEGAILAIGADLKARIEKLVGRILIDPIGAPLGKNPRLLERPLTVDHPENPALYVIVDKVTFEEESLKELKKEFEFDMPKTTTHIGAEGMAAWAEELPFERSLELTPAEAASPTRTLSHYELLDLVSGTQERRAFNRLLESAENMMVATIKAQSALQAEENSRHAEQLAEAQRIFNARMDEETQQRETEFARRQKETQQLRSELVEARKEQRELERKLNALEFEKTECQRRISQLEERIHVLESQRHDDDDGFCSIA